MTEFEKKRFSVKGLAIDFCDKCKHVLNEQGECPNCSKSKHEKAGGKK